MNKILLLLIWFMLIGQPRTLLAESRSKKSKQNPKKWQEATFAGGCFWCMGPPFDILEGVTSTTVGYTGGAMIDPTYKAVCSGKTGHAEAVEIFYDPDQISYEKMLSVFWRNIDPTTENRQFVDIGPQYRTAIFYHNGVQKALAETSKKELDSSGRFEKKIVTEIVPASRFYQAETYHQDYYQKHPVQYHFYRIGSGRDQYIERIWGKD